ncbi:MAG: DUF2520 domain-containing protein [Bacteroidaceae bacterium]|nr:DUF2520 domain-containing protein [Bacteroidaceae bacterium]
MGTRTYSTVLIGRGNVASHLEEAFVKAGHNVISVGGRERTMPIPKDADLYVIAVTDSAIASVAAEIGDVPGLVVHTAGSVPMSVLPQRNRGVLYPLQTFTKGQPINMQAVPLFIESDGDVRLLRQIAGQISGNVMEMDSAHRSYLHLAAVFCCNFTNHMYRLAESMLAAQNIPFSVMLPLIDETARKVHRLSPAQAQTGPAVRWNEEVMQAQVNLLERDDLKQLYQIISKSIHHDKLRSQED